MSDTGYKPSAAELHYQKLGAKQLMEVLTDGHGTTVSVDWNRLASGIDCGAAGGDSSGQVGAVTGGLGGVVTIANGLFAVVMIAALARGEYGAIAAIVTGGLYYGITTIIALVVLSGTHRYSNRTE